MLFGTMSRGRGSDADLTESGLRTVARISFESILYELQVGLTAQVLVPDLNITLLLSRPLRLKAFFARCSHSMYISLLSCLCRYYYHRLSRSSLILNVTHVLSRIITDR